MKLRRVLAATPLVLLVALLFSACVSVENPQGWGSPAFSGDSVVLQESKDHLAGNALTAEGGSRTWVFPDKRNPQDKDVKLRAIYGTPVIDGDAVYSSSFGGGVFALNKFDGRPIWRITTGFSGDIVAGVSVSGGKVAFATTDGDVHVVNAKDGRASDGWPAGGVKYGKGIWTAPIIKGDVVYVAVMDGKVDALKLADGSKAWSQPFDATGAIASLQLLDDNHLFAPSLNKHVYILNAADGSVAQDFHAADWVWAGAAFKDNVAYFGDFSGRAYALDITTGRDRWPAVSLGKDRVKSGPAIVDDVVVFGDRVPAVHFLKASDGSRLGIGVPLNGAGTLRADAVAKDGQVYFVTTAGRLFKADPGTQTVNEVVVNGARQ